MKSISLYFQVHQPFRLRTYRFFDIGNKHNYFDEYSNRVAIQNAAFKSYLPANEIMLGLAKKHGEKFRVTFGISGIALAQLQAYAPEVLDSFRRLADTGCVEFLGETYAHSLAAIKSHTEFTRQVAKHSDAIESLFGKRPTSFRNTELVISDEIAGIVADMGFKALVAEGAKHILGWKSPNYLYCSTMYPKLKILLRNFPLSDDLSFRFSEQNWIEFPLTAEKYLHWLMNLNPAEELVNLFMPYETFGLYQPASSGIFSFLNAFVDQTIASGNFAFSSPSEVAENHQPISGVSFPFPVSWADEERDLTSWLGNDLQKEALSKLHQFEDKILKCKNAAIIQDWEKLQTSDHLYYMSTKWFSDGVIVRNTSPFSSPYDAFINFMNCLSDLMLRVESSCSEPDNAGNLPLKTKTLKQSSLKAAPVQAPKDSAPVKQKRAKRII